ncbi:hemolysin family protein [Glutamicibacter sp. NPDC087344]|uniref:hemolysin family protein n=1 Tax=Glutamicibacter sp. NPDC087344 TaxID=3363994 RepID=UPI0037F1902D
MDGSTLQSLLLVIFFVLLGGVFAGTEMALVSLRESQIVQLEKSGGRGARTAKLARDPNLFLAAVQIGVTLSGFFSAAYGASTLAPDLAPLLVRLGLAENTAQSTAFIGITVLIAYLSLVLGELVPKRLAMQNAAGFTRVLAPPLGVFAWLMRPVIALLSFSTNTALRLLGADPSVKSETFGSEELRHLVRENEELHEDSRAILGDVFNAGERTLREVMRPRTEVQMLDATLSIAEARDKVAALPYSRYPVIGESKDDVLGFIHVRDLYAEHDEHPASIGQLAREVLVLPGTKQILRTMAQMRREQRHMVLVADEYGGTDGIVTLEDLVEEIIGEVYDEFDTDVESEDRVLHRGRWLQIDGGLILQEFAGLTGVHLPEGPYETVAGFLASRLGRMPAVNDAVQAAGLQLTVQTLNGRRVGWIRVENPADEKWPAGPADDLPD